MILLMQILHQRLPLCAKTERGLEIISGHSQVNVNLRDDITRA
jgi:hypothetical protein